MTVSEKTIEVIVVPRASKTEIVDYPGAALKIRLQAPPVDGAANEELIRFLAEHFKKNKTQITIIRGHSSRKKLVRIS